MKEKIKSAKQQLDEMWKAKERGDYQYEILTAVESTASLYNLMQSLGRKAESFIITDAYGNDTEIISG